MQVIQANYEVGDKLSPLKQTVSVMQLFRYSAVTWNPHRIHFDEPYARQEGHQGLAAHSHLRAALALRCVTEGLGPDWRITAFSYRLRKPVYTPAELSYTARVVGVDDETITLSLSEESPSGEDGFEGIVEVRRSEGSEGGAQ